MPESNPAIEDDLTLLSQAAREAGRIAMRYFGNRPKVWTKPGNSPVSEADFAVDAFLKRILLDARPDYGWLSEETDDERTGQSFRRFFVVDPIDGTRGFLERRAEWCISVAVVEDGRPLAGVLECPVKEEHFLAAMGKPALMNGNIIQVAAPHVREKPTVCCNWPMVRKLPQSFVDSVIFKTDIPSLAYRIALLSRGSVDAVFIRPSCHDWDIAAADLILRQGGGLLAGVDGKPVLYHRPPFCHGFLIAGRNENFGDMLDVARKADLN